MAKRGICDRRNSEVGEVTPAHTHTHTHTRTHTHTHTTGKASTRSANPENSPIHTVVPLYTLSSTAFCTKRSWP